MDGTNLVPAPPQKPIDLRFPYVVKQCGPAWLALILFDVS